MGGVVTAIFAGLVWSGSDYFRILIGAGPKESDEESMREYYSASKLGTLVRSVGLVFGFACPILFVVAALGDFGYDNAMRFAAIVSAILCGVIYSCADQLEEFLYGKLKE